MLQFLKHSVLVCLTLLFLCAPGMVLAQEEAKYTDKLKEIEELKGKISQLQGEARTLSSAISYLTNKKVLTQKQVEATEFEISVITRDIASLGGKIETLEGTLDEHTRALIADVQAGYKKGQVDPYQLVFSSQSFADLSTRARYIQLASAHHSQMLKKTTEVKISYDEQKLEKENKQKQVEDLKQKLQKQQADLAAQELAKQRLLTETKNNESNYQKQLAQALAEKEAIQRALVTGKKVGPVKRGDPIALVGNSGYPGCSSGKHLHFEVRKGSVWVDPAPYLQNKTVLDEEKNGQLVAVGSGSWSWPIEDQIRLTQHYGQTPWSWRYAYSGGIHTGFDMVSKSGDIIRAPADGNLFKSSEKCGSSSTINIVYIEHGDNVISFYLHVQ